MVRTLRLNGTKVTLRNAFIDNLFALESEKELKKPKEPIFQNACELFTCLLTLIPRIPHICGFLDCFNFSHFLTTYCCF